jgi:outer membrane protein assembly factor BamB
VGSTLSTAGGVVFTGDHNGNLVALDSRTGTDLWHFCTSHRLFASPVTYKVDAHRYVAIAAEDDAFTFGLFEGKSNQ